MLVKLGFLVITLLIGSIAIPIKNGGEDLSASYGQSDSSSRIVGGSPAGLVSYMVGLVVGNLRTFLCGGSLITTTHVLTAAHCVLALPSGDLARLLRGLVGTDRYHRGGTEHRFSNGIVHPEYNRRTKKNDISILFTSTEVVLSDTVSLATLNFDFIDAGVSTTTYGWGITRRFGTPSERLLSLNGTVIEGSQCVTQMAQRAEESGAITIPAVDPTVEICTYISVGNGTCNGDSGSPLMHAELNEQIGIVAWGLPCARGAPDIFVRVSAYQSWIEQNIA